MPTLLLYYPEKEKRWTVEVPAKRFTIGRAPDVEVRVPHTSVSKKHVLVERKGHRYVFRDLKSKNGVYLNDFRIRQGSLEDGDELRLGSIKITFYEGKPPATLDSSPVDNSIQAAGLNEESEEENALSRSETATFMAVTPPAPAEDAPSMAPEDPKTEEEPLTASSEEGLREEPVSNVEGAEWEKEEEPPPRPAPERAEMFRELRARRGRSEPRPEALVPRQWSMKTPALLLAGGAAIALGLLLGYLGSFFDAPSPETKTEGKLAGSAPGSSTSLEPTPSSEPESAAEKMPESPLGPQAALGDPETRARLVVRLYIDILDRPPTRQEMGELSSLSAEDLWLRVSKSLRPPRSAEEQIMGVFPRFLGRKAEPAERDAILSLAKGDPEHYGFLVALSQTYASQNQRRKRPESLLAKSLCVNLLDEVPTEADEKKVLKALRDRKSGARGAAQFLLLSGRSKSGPRQDEPKESWIRDAYSRFLLRFPTADEVKKTMLEMEKGKDGWHQVLLDLASREEYLKY